MTFWITSNKMDFIAYLHRTAVHIQLRRIKVTYLSISTLNKISKNLFFFFRLVFVVEGSLVLILTIVTSVSFSPSLAGSRKKFSKCGRSLTAAVCGRNVLLFRQARAESFRPTPKCERTCSIRNIGARTETCSRPSSCFATD